MTKISRNHAAVAQPEAYRAAAIQEGVVAYDVVGRLQRHDLVFAAASFQKILFDGRERTPAGSAQIVAASADGLVPIFAVREDDVAEVVVVNAIMLRTDKRGIITANKDVAAAIDLALKPVVINAVVAASGTVHGDPMLPVPWLGTLAQAERVSRHLRMPAVDELHGLLVGVVRKLETFQNQMLTISDDETSNTANRCPAAMFRAQNDRSLGRAVFPLDAYWARRLVVAIGCQDCHARVKPLYRLFNASSESTAASAGSEASSRAIGSTRGCCIGLLPTSIREK